MAETLSTHATGIGAKGGSPEWQVKKVRLISHNKAKRCKPTNRSKPASLSASIPVNAYISRGSTGSNQIRPAIAIKISSYQILNSHAALIHQMACPILARNIPAKNPHTAFFTVLRRQVVTHTKHQFIGTIAIEVCAGNGMAPLQALIENLSFPNTIHAPRNNKFMTMPWLDSRVHLFTTRQRAQANLAGSPIRFRSILIARMQQLPLPT
jgi:hypothetical protein